MKTPVLAPAALVVVLAGSSVAAQNLVVVPDFGGPVVVGPAVMMTPPRAIGSAPAPRFVPRSPVLGMNVPVQPLVGRPWNARNTRFVGIRDLQDRTVPARRTGQLIDATPSGREADRADGAASQVTIRLDPMGEIRSAAADAEQLQMTRHVENIMENRPLREGMVTAVGATGVVVRYDLNGQMKTERFSVNQAFFFDEDGRLATIATSPGTISVGDRVMIPTDENQPRRAAARSREVIRKTVVRKQPPSGRTTVRARVAGARQAGPGRSPTK